MTEADVALTDYAVALESLLFLVFLGRDAKYSPEPRYWMMIFFASVGAASFFGGTVHGFFLSEQTLGYKILWPATLLAMGVTAVSMWAIGAHLLFSRHLMRWVLMAAGIQFALYAVFVLFRTQGFWAGIADNLPALFFLQLSLVLTYRRKKHGRLLLAVGGPALVLVAALLQYVQLGVHPVYFNHNALYHVLQAIALLLLFQGGQWLLSADAIGEQRSGQVPDPAVSGSRR